MTRLAGCDRLAWHHDAMDTTPRPRSAWRFIGMLVIGLVLGVVVGTLTRWQYGLLVGWAAACATYIGSSVAITINLSSAETKTHALREDPGRAGFEIGIIAASISSIVVIVVLLIGADASHGIDRYAIPIVGLVTIFLTWALLQTLYTLRYARLYYGGDSEGGIDFNGSGDPDYRDFSYVAYTLGMTYQISDTNISSKDIRWTILRHCVLSYLFGAVILASTVNVVAGLAG